MVKKNKGFTAHNAMGSSQDAYIKSILGQNSQKKSLDFVETFIEEKQKQLRKEKNVQKK